MHDVQRGLQVARQASSAQRLELGAYSGQHRWDLNDAVPIGCSWDEHRRLLGRHEPFRDFQFVVFPKTRPARYLSSSGEPMFGGGTFRGYRGVTRDVTDFWLAKQKLASAHQLLKSAAELAKLGSWWIDLPSGAVTWVERITRSADLTVQHASTIEEALATLEPDSLEAVRSAYDDCVATRELRTVLVRERPEAGGRYFQLCAEPTVNERGEIVRVQGAIQDVTEMHQRARAWRDTLDRLTDGFGAIDRDWRIRYVNPAGQHILQSTESALVGNVLWDCFPAAVGSDFETQYRRAMEQRVAVTFEAHYPPLQVWVRVNAFPTLEGIGVSFIDTTRLHTQHDEIAELNATLEKRIAHRTGELEAAHREIQFVSYAIAHDLRAPLAAIVGFGQVLTERYAGAFPSEAVRLLGRIVLAGKRMDEMTAGVLALSRISQAGLHKEPVNLSEVAMQCVASFADADPARKVEVAIEPSVWADADRGMIGSVIQNLLSNAWKYTRNTPSAIVEFGQTRTDAGEVVFFVKDNGAGFPAGDAQRIFEPFFRLHDKEFEGAGIGLATVSRIIERHGGRIWAEPGAAGGATFWFTLPPRNIQDRGENHD